MVDRDVIQALRAIKALALQHHGDEPPATLLHALLVEIPAECDSALAALDAAGARPTPRADAHDEGAKMCSWCGGQGYVDGSVNLVPHRVPCVRCKPPPAPSRPVAVAWDAVRAERESALAIEPDALVNAIMGSDLVRLYGIKHVEIVRYHARQIARVYRALAAERAAPATGGHDGKGE